MAQNSVFNFGYDSYSKYCHVIRQNYLKFILNDYDYHLLNHNFFCHFFKDFISIIYVQNRFVLNTSVNPA